MRVKLDSLVEEHIHEHQTEAGQIWNIIVGPSKHTTQYISKKTRLIIEAENEEEKELLRECFSATSASGVRYTYIHPDSGSVLLTEV